MGNHLSGANIQQFHCHPEVTIGIFSITRKAHGLFQSVESYLIQPNHLSKSYLKTCDHSSQLPCLAFSWSDFSVWQIQFPHSNGPTTRKYIAGSNSYLVLHSEISLFFQYQKNERVFMRSYYHEIFIRRKKNRIREARNKSLSFLLSLMVTFFQINQKSQRFSRNIHQDYGRVCYNLDT